MSTGIHCGIRCGALVGIGAGDLPAVPPGVVAATLDTRTMKVATLLANWFAMLTWHALGTGGNAGQLDMFFMDGDPHSAEVRDNQRYNGATWEAAPDVIGVLVTATALLDDITVGEIEAAIIAASSLAQVTTHDATPSKTVNMLVMESVNAIGTFSGGS